MKWPTVISEKDRKFIERVDQERILSENEIDKLMDRCQKESKKRYHKKLDFYRQNPVLANDLVIDTFNEIFKNEKILITNLRLVWNPYNWTHPRLPKEGFPIEYKKFRRILSKGHYSGDRKSEYKFILLLEDPKEIRNIKLKIKRRKQREQGISRWCKECGQKFQAFHKDAVFCSKACKMRDYRKRKKGL